MEFEKNEAIRYKRLAKGILSKALTDARKPVFLETLNDIELHFELFAKSEMCELCCSLADIDVGRYRKLLAENLEKGLEALRVKRIKYTQLRGYLNEGTDDSKAEEPAERSENLSLPT